MAVLKCKMCGANLNITDDQTVCECEYCGSKQTIPKADDEKKVKLFERANRLRRNCEFDKAASVYESIVADFEEEAEAYWGLVLCNFGIEYVDDPASGDKIPTCHRSSFDSVMDDSDFELVMEYADPIAKRVYREQAKQIEEIRKGIVEISGKEHPYDIFICYKETDDNGERTLDSVLAQDVYDALAAKGYRVFFSRISLEDKLGTEYEPYIFAALNSAKVMLVLGTDYEYYDSVWVKNEWSRFLKLMTKDKRKHLIPCYKGIDAYGIPKEFARLQAQDMGKVGAVQDLIRGIDKLFGKTEKALDAGHETVIHQVVSGGPNIDALLKRGYDTLEDGAFDEAKIFFNDALNSNARSADAYLGLFMAEIKASYKAEAQLKYVSGNYTENRYWKRAKQYASATLSDTLSSWDSLRDERLQREAEEAGRIKRETEEAKRKKQEEIAKLQEQLRTGNFEMTEEEEREYESLKADAKSAEKAATDAEAALADATEVQEITRLENLISSKKTQIESLGIFKGREKKELQAQIDSLEKTLAEGRKRVSEKQIQVSQLKEHAEDVKRTAAWYKEDKIKEIRIKIDTLTIQCAEDMVIFGKYNQGNGIKPIEWWVLDRQGSKTLLISKYGLDCKLYHERHEDITWEFCSLRKWLNSEFLDIAFSPAEQSLIENTYCPADKNPKYDTPPGNSTTDKVFLLSIPEVKKYFKTDVDRRAAKADEAEKQYDRRFNDLLDTTTDGKTAHHWWLRSPGDQSYNTAFVESDGSVCCFGFLVDNGSCVRPALWINLGY